MSKKDYIAINRELWNKRTAIHLQSSFYDVAGFVNGKNSLNPIERIMLGDVCNKSLLHLQCHFGQDSISLARLGAKVTGVDLSDKSIEEAKSLCIKTNTEVDFICCDLYALPQHLEKQFDIVFTSYGTIGWLPDLSSWAKLISRYLKHNGKFVFVDFHPFVWMFDPSFEKISYRYFNTGEIVEEELGTYADNKAEIKLESVGWNHSTSEVLTSLLDAGLKIDSFSEYDYSPYNCFEGMNEDEPGKFRLKKFDSKIPLLFSLAASKAK